MRASTALLLLSMLVQTVAADELIETEIKGELLKNGFPVIGAEIVSCRDYKSGPFTWPTCNERISVRTDALGRFSFLKFTGISPATFKCASPCARDPSWYYWFLVQDGSGKNSLFESGMGFGRLYVRAVCDLAGKPRYGDGLACMTIDVEQPHRLLQ